VHDDFFEGTGNVGGWAFKFANIGDRVWGTIIDVRKTTCFKYSANPNAPKVEETNRDGSVRTQLEITIQTDLRGMAGLSKWPTDDQGQPLPAEADEGLRKLYVKQNSNLQYKVGDALLAAGSNGHRAQLENGALLAVTFVGERAGNEGNPAKQFEVQFKAAPPQAPSQDAFFQGQPQQAPQQQGPTPPPAQPQYQQPPQQQQFAPPPAQQQPVYQQAPPQPQQAPPAQPYQAAPQQQFAPPPAQQGPPQQPQFAQAPPQQPQQPWAQPTQADEPPF
jgi:hypothetical protein